MIQRRAFFRANWYENRAWRQAVIKRDKFQCRKCGARSRKMLQVHHIKKRSEFHSLSKDINNGITLCRKCHAEMKGSEENFERLCLLLIGKPKMIAKIGRMMYDLKEEDESENNKGQ